MNMDFLVILFGLTPWLVIGSCNDEANITGLLSNSSDPNQDMYVIHAMVYQVGILTNKTDNETENGYNAGHQETVTFYHTNGSNVDLSKIPTPLMTNVTAQSIVGVAPTQTGNLTANTQLPWAAFDHLTSLHQSTPIVMPDNLKPKEVSEGRGNSEDKIKNIGKRSLDSPFTFVDMQKRDLASENKTPVKIENGVAIIPQEAGLQSVALPPLLALNNNFSDIPVPIPNTSVVHYAKINTLVQMP